MNPLGPVIDDNNYTQWIDGGNRGYRGMWLDNHALRKALSFEDLGIPLIPESEWDDHIRQQQKDESTLVDLCRQMKLDCKNQSRTNYCWVNAPVHCCEVVRLMETGQVVSYSPASCGAPVKSFRNIGGWGSQALNRLRTHGVNYSEDWPDNAISRSYYNSRNQAKAKAHTVKEYAVLQSWEERGSCILAGYPIADGYMWWRHEVTGMALTLGDHDLIFRNSWGMQYGEDGFATLAGQRKHADDSVAIIAMNAI